MQGTGLISRMMALVALLAMTGCGTLIAPGATAPQVPAVAVVPAGAAPPPPRGARTAEAFDTTTAAQRQAATAATRAGASLGRVSVGLGDPTATGFWLKGALVSEAGPGVVRGPGGKTVQVDLQPGAGAAQLSLAAYRALGLSLTDLPEVEVLRR